MKTLISAQNLSFHYHVDPILKNVDFTLQAGELVGIVGPNGAGKSTLLRSLARILNPSSGSIQYFNGEENEILDPNLCRSLSYLPQRQEVSWPLLVETVVALGRFPHLMPFQGLSNTDLLAVEAAMNETGVTHLRHRPMNELSGGERTLVLMARALANQPKMILADEPIQGLDPNHELQMMGILHARVKSGCGVVIVLHHLMLAARFCDRLYLMHEGKVTASGKPSEVLSPENLKLSYAVEAHRLQIGKDFFLIPWSRL